MAWNGLDTRFLNPNVATVPANVASVNVIFVRPALRRKRAPPASKRPFNIAVSYTHLTLPTKRIV